MLRTATIEDPYRYDLTRAWSGGLGKQTFTWVMLNPSIADASIDDMTIMKCVGFTERNGGGSIAVVNLFAYRATDPNDLIDAAGAGVDPVGQRNNTFIERWMLSSARVVVAWGATPLAKNRVAAVQEIADVHRIPLYCLGTTKDGSPRHPSRIGYATPMVRW